MCESLGHRLCERLLAGRSCCGIPLAEAKADADLDVGHVGKRRGGGKEEIQQAAEQIETNR
jgi:hypothetical protein